MNSKVLLVLRILFGLFLLTFGLNKFFHFIPFGEMSEGAMSYFTALSTAKVVILVGIIEILAGLSLLLNKYAALMMLILMSVSVNAMLFHLAFAPQPDAIAGAVILLVLNIVMLYAYKDKYSDLLKG